ncbi:hypothetical protein EMIHUDRAFT_219564 [Emiliania huxleyi CCMP1516]|uniref:Uncharacterized protein n=2 Tax=Emiliania huxleyi TaxID=2903 RepID=A0A0D3I4L3_EMIH1|nr:hypothetical protein EMIHUDRAFT_219564 [Emiliania huxleyi CCMP1516]EOD06198.1 hypothetical protein EMIHUDRAFT_219564 [Emiliania huxleyi CCMP1516]|eukprot:XP_005758627.1 hypothetical protein EMIHUDRAFT_219564 [Emiliania huxleyi CCMP1516]
MWASGPAAAARPVEAGLGPARDGWPPTSALALLVKMAAVAIAATVVQSYSRDPLYYKEVLTRSYPKNFYPHDSEHECIRGILWVVQSIDLWLVSRPPDDRVELIGAGSLGYGTGPSFG